METLERTDLVHGAHVDDAVPLRRHPQDLIQDLLHVQLLTLSVVEPVDDRGAFHSQLLQHSTSGGYRPGDRRAAASRLITSASLKGNTIAPPSGGGGDRTLYFCFVVVCLYHE